METDKMHYLASFVSQFALHLCKEVVEDETLIEIEFWRFMQIKRSKRKPIQSIDFHDVMN